MSKSLIHSLTFDELTTACKTAGFPNFRATQIWQWLYCRCVTNGDAMHNISAPVRDWLNDTFILKAAELQETIGTSDKTRKLLVRLSDGDAVEAVLLPGRDDHYTVCISCQIGCRFHCAFCASGQAGFYRNLEAGEMVGQVLTAIDCRGKRPSNIVFMGMGEPFDNIDAVLKAAHILNASDGLNIGARKITVSTSGITPGIRRFAAEPCQFELSVSLHAPNDAIRSQLMPINKRYPLPALIKACRKYTDSTNRIITFEYILIRDCNDKPSHARELADLLRDFPCRVNLIPLSPVAEFDAKPAHPETAQMFINVLGNAHINATLRYSQGTSLKAACGQLRFPETTMDQT